MTTTYRFRKLLGADDSRAVNRLIRKRLAPACGLCGVFPSRHDTTEFYERFGHRDGRGEPCAGPDIQEVEA